MVFENLTQARKLTGLSYIGMVNNSAKHEKAYSYNEHVYTIYLAPGKSSGYEVCPGRTVECTAACLNFSGRNKMVSEMNRIESSRITKTKLFFEHREFFVRWVTAEITAAKKKADKLGYRFSVRLNNTSDISPEDFYCYSELFERNINILEWFQSVQFYEYSKVESRVELTKKYKNFDLTFSYNGNNKETCINMLKNNIRVAVVFEVVPDTFWGYPVIDSSKYDMRYLDPKNIIIGLPYKKVRNKLEKSNKFVIQL